MFPNKSKKVTKILGSRRLISQQSKENQVKIGITKHKYPNKERKIWQRLGWHYNNTPIKK